MSPLIPVTYYFYIVKPIVKDDKYRMAGTIRLWNSLLGQSRVLMWCLFFPPFLLPYIFMIRQPLFSHLREMQGELGEYCQGYHGKV